MSQAASSVRAGPPASLEGQRAALQPWPGEQRVVGGSLLWPGRCRDAVCLSVTLWPQGLGTSLLERRHRNQWD